MLVWLKTRPVVQNTFSLVMLATKEMGHMLVMHFPPCKVLYRLLSMYLLDESHMEVLRGPQNFLEDTQPPLHVILN